MATTVTSQLQGITISEAIKAPCKAVATSNITLSGLQTVGGVVLVADDRVLVTAQTSGVDNGIYVASTSTWQRAKDMDGNRDVVSGTRVLIRNSGIDGVEYELTTANPITIGTTSLTFVRRYGANATYDQTEAEISAGVVPVNDNEPPGEVLRFGDNTVPGTTDVSGHIQDAVDSASDIHAEVYLRDDNAISTPILIRTTTTQNVSIVGNGRVSTIIRPTAASISTSPQNINALFINQNNNGHLHLRRFRCLDAAAYTGKFLYAVEGGGGDGSGQALFSAVVEDCWFAFSSNNSGIFQGGFSNLMVRGNTFEGTKDACFILQGGGNGDHQYIGNVMNACYDNFIRQEDDGNLVNTVLVDGLHVYQHLRGRIFDFTEAKQVNINNVIVEFDAANVGDCGLVKLKDCADIRVTNCIVGTTAGSPRGDVGIDIIDGNSAYFSNVKVTCDVGLRLQGTGVIDLTFVDCDFTGCQYAFQQLSGTLSGKIRFINCRLNDSDEYGMLHSAGTPSFDIDFIGGEILNAGMTGITTSRNINIDTSGDVRFVGTKIGQNDGDADAAYYFRVDGAGAFKVIDCPIIGTPPTGIRDTSSTQTIQFVWERGADLAGAKTFQWTAASTAVVADTEVQAGSLIVFMPTNAAAANLMAGSKAPYISARNSGVSFTLTTADGTNAAGTENFAYRILP